MTAADYSAEKARRGLRDLLKDAFKEKGATPAEERAIAAAEAKRVRRRERNLRNAQREKDRGR